MDVSGIVAVVVVLAAPFQPCHVHPKPEGSTLTQFGVRHMTCAAAAAAARAGGFATPPGGLHFHTKGFSCSSPVGPPLPQSGPRFFTCDRGGASFRFHVLGTE